MYTQVDFYVMKYYTIMLLQQSGTSIARQSEIMPNVS